MPLRRVVKQFRNFRQGQEGAAVVEFALVASMLTLLLLGMWDFGRLIEAWLITSSAAREGARYGAVYGADQVLSQTDVVSLTKGKAFEYVQLGLGSRGDVEPYSVDNVTVDFPNGRLPGQRVEVTVFLQVNVWPLIRDLFFGGSDMATIRSVATMRI